MVMDADTSMGLGTRTHHSGWAQTATNPQIEMTHQATPNGRAHASLADSSKCAATQIRRTRKGHASGAQKRNAHK